MLPIGAGGIHRFLLFFALNTIQEVAGDLILIYDASEKVVKCTCGVCLVHVDLIDVDLIGQGPPGGWPVGLLSLPQLPAQPPMLLLAFLS